MTFTAKTERCLVELVQLTIASKGSIKPSDLVQGFKSGKIPDDIKNEDQKETGVWLTITGSEYIQYEKCLRLLEKEPLLEYISKRGIDKELWHFICQVFLESDLLKRKSDIKHKINMLQNRLIKPLEQYEILIPIVNNLELDAHDFQIEDIKFRKMTENDLLAWGVHKDIPIHKLLYEATVDKTVALLTEKGNDPWKAAERAKERLSTALNALRIALLIDHEPRIIGWKIHDEQMLFKQGEHVSVKKKGSSNLVLPSWERDFRSIELRVDDLMSKQIAKSLILISCLFNDIVIKGSIRDKITRAMEWIGNSVTREALDDKVVDICTALETLLATEQDRLKGETISLRMILLYSSLDRPFFNPIQLLELYNKRSKIVHGSDRNICSTYDYTSGRWIVTDIFKTVLEYIQNKSITKHGKFLVSLQSDKTANQKAVEWWMPTKHYQNILKVAHEMNLLHNDSP